jgi:adenylate cyclase
VTSLLETPTGLQLGGEKRKITILMTDLRGFSTISEQLPPEQVVSLLNHYLEAMTEVVTHYGGLVNQVIGDGIVVFFGALNQKPDDAERAVACAIAMQLAMEAVNQQNKAAKLPLLEMGIGINTGEVIVGNIGSLKHAQFTAIGSHMNLASRIESFSVGGQVLISQFTLDEVLNLQIRQKTQARMKGIQTPITLYEVSGIGGVYNLRLPDPQTDLFHLPQEIPIWYKLLEGKQVVGPPIYASLVSLSLKGAEVRSNQAIAPLSNIKVNLMPPIVPDSLHEDIYAKVVSTKVSDIEGFRIHFTHISPKMANYLLSLTGRQSRSFLPTHTSTSTFPDNA